MVGTNLNRVLMSLKIKLYLHILKFYNARNYKHILLNKITFYSIFKSFFLNCVGIVQNILLIQLKYKKSHV